MSNKITGESVVFEESGELILTPYTNNIEEPRTRAVVEAELKEIELKIFQNRKGDATPYMDRALALKEELTAFDRVK